MNSSSMVTSAYTPTTLTTLTVNNLQSYYPLPPYPTCLLSNSHTKSHPKPCYYFQPNYIFISDLTPSCKSKHLTKYADDASLLVLENTDAQINDEFQNVLKWASQYKLTVNIAKTKEIVFHKLNPRNYVPQIQYRVLNKSYL